VVSPNTISKALHASRNRKHCGSDLGIPKGSILRGNDQIAGEGKLKTASLRTALHRCERRHSFAASNAARARASERQIPSFS
jgi:hypothetical protein